MSVGLTRSLADSEWLALDDASELRAAVAVLRRRAENTFILRFVIRALLGAAKSIESQD
jgi:hypothetical protein